MKNLTYILADPDTGKSLGTIWSPPQQPNDYVAGIQFVQCDALILRPIRNARRTAAQRNSPKKESLLAIARSFSSIY